MIDRDELVGCFVALMESEPDGFLMDHNGHPVDPDVGYAVGVKSTASVEDAVSHMQQGQYSGYWFDDEVGSVHFDVVEVYGGMATAVLAGLLAGQKAIYDFSRDEIVDLSPFLKDNDDAQRSGRGVAAEAVGVEEVAAAEGAGGDPAEE